MRDEPPEPSEPPELSEPPESAREEYRVESDETSAGSLDVGAAGKAAPSTGGGVSLPGSATAAQGCATTAPPVADTAARSRPETRVARREDIRGVIAGSSSI
ncbi:hypothetical protein GCM10010116_31940 [Microbispora rosea subsp. aerata]|nr:hypothetical protein GCM10010116_31940 [Microbispora rosea subsp. aerata]GIH55799.1 hypothetical protein Mro02_27130 [Microbispora rosea subsp. aerata]GLJ83288.1 hypothetical protein GCM10017588_20150 [Microbispora rosea subsp. aerata]